MIKNFLLNNNRTPSLNSVNYYSSLSGDRLIFGGGNNYMQSSKYNQNKYISSYEYYNYLNVKLSVDNRYLDKQVILDINRNKQVPINQDFNCLGPKGIFIL